MESDFLLALIFNMHKKILHSTSLLLLQFANAIVKTAYHSDFSGFPIGYCTEY